MFDLKTCQNLGRVHPGLENFEGHLANDWFDLLCQVDLAKSSLTDLADDAVVPDLRTIATEAQASNVVSPGMLELSERASRTVTAIDNWLAVEDSLRREDYPDAQLLRDRMRMANSRWPLEDRIPSRVQELARRVEAYYESGENEKQPIL